MADELCSHLEELTFYFDRAKYCRTEVFELGLFILVLSSVSSRP